MINPALLCEIPILVVTVVLPVVLQSHCHLCHHRCCLSCHGCAATCATSVWKSSCTTGKRLRLDWTKTDQDWKFTRLIKTTTMVQSLVHHIFKVFKTSKNQSKPVSTGLSGLKCKLG